MEKVINPIHTELFSHSNKKVKEVKKNTKHVDGTKQKTFYNSQFYAFLENVRHKIFICCVQCKTDNALKCHVFK
jgi:hypothetical protein